MKNLFIPLLAAALVGVAPLSFAEEADTPLEEQMDVIGDSFKALKKVTKNDEGAKLARDMQEAFLKAYTMTPKLVTKGKHPGSKDRAMAGYRVKIAEALVLASEIEAAYLDGDAAKAKELAEKLGDVRKEGHDEFKEKDED